MEGLYTLDDALKKRSEIEVDLTSPRTQKEADKLLLDYILKLTGDGRSVRVKKDVVYIPDLVPMNKVDPAQLEALREVYSNGIFPTGIAEVLIDSETGEKHLVNTDGNHRAFILYYDFDRSEIEMYVIKAGLCGRVEDIGLGKKFWELDKYVLIE